MQLTLAILDPPDPKPPAPQLVPIPWERIDAEARRAALDLLACLIARILVRAAEGTSDESPCCMDPAGIQ